MKFLKQNLLLSLISIFLSSTLAHAQSTVHAPIGSVTAIPIAGSTAAGVGRPMRVDADGALVVSGVLSGGGTPYLVAFNTELDDSLQVKTTSGTLSKAACRIDSTAASDDYYIQVINSATLPANGAVTLLMSPVKVVHTNGVDSAVDIDLTPNNITATNGIFLVSSTTEFTKTISTGNVMACTALYN